MAGDDAGGCVVGMIRGVGYARIFSGDVIVTRNVDYVSATDVTGIEAWPFNSIVRFGQCRRGVAFRGGEIGRGQRVEGDIGMHGPRDRPVHASLYVCLQLYWHAVSATVQVAESMF